MKRWKFLPHTADVRLYVEADTLEELYSAAVLAMNEILREDSCSDDSEYGTQEELSIKSFDSTTLFIDFLSDVLTLSHQLKALFCKVEMISLDNNQLEARIYGKKVPEFHDDIKAVTYHEAEVKINKNGNWESIVIFDI